MRLYHFTTEDNLDRILETGCIKQSEGGVVWLTKNREIESQRWPDANQATVRISVSLLNIAHFGKTPTLQNQMRGAGDWYITEKAIPQKLWVDVEVYKKGHWGIHKGLSYKNRKM